MKNKLFIKALEKIGADVEALKPVLKETTAIMFSNVANKPARIIKDFGKNNNDMPGFKAAYAEDNYYVGADQLNTLVALKSKNELIADVIAALESPIMNVVSALENKENKAEEAAAE